MATLTDRRKEPGWHGEKRWLVRWENPPGKTPRRPSKGFERKGDAERFKRQIETTLERNEQVDLRSASMAFADLAEFWWTRKAMKLKPHTRRGYRRLLDGHVLPYFKALPQNTITAETVADFVGEKLKPTKERPNGYDRKYVRDMVSVVSRVMAYAKEDMTPPLRFDNPARNAGITVQRKKKAASDVNMLTMETAELLANAVRSPYRPLVWTLLYTGVRPAEACGFRVGHFDHENHRLHVVETRNFIHGYAGIQATEEYDTPKTAAGDRVIILPAWVADEIQEMLESRRRRLGRPLHHDDPLFEAVKGGPLNPDKLRKTIIRPGLIKAGLNPAIRTYDVRHSTATMLIDSGVPAPIVADHMGHSDIRVQGLTYHHSSDKSKQLAPDALEKTRRKATKKAKKKARKASGTGTDGVVVDIDARRPKG